MTKREAEAAALNEVRREQTRLQYLANSDVFDGWEWVASKSMRTCLPCLMMDGMQFSLDTPFNAVQRCTNEYCRCTLIAVISGVERPPRQLGSEWVATLSAEEKRNLGGGCVE